MCQKLLDLLSRARAGEQPKRKDVVTRQEILEKYSPAFGQQEEMESQDPDTVRDSSDGAEDVEEVMPNLSPQGEGFAELDEAEEGVDDADGEDESPRPFEADVSMTASLTSDISLASDVSPAVHPHGAVAQQAGRHDDGQLDDADRRAPPPAHLAADAFETTSVEVSGYVFDSSRRKSYDGSAGKVEDARKTDRCTQGTQVVCVRYLRH